MADLTAKVTSAINPISRLNLTGLTARINRLRSRSFMVSFLFVLLGAVALVALLQASVAALVAGAAYGSTGGRRGYDSTFGTKRGVVPLCKLHRSLQSGYPLHPDPCARVRFKVLHITVE